MKKNKIVLASILAMLGTSAMAQSNVKGAMEASARIESFCQINAQDVNFGVVSLPLTAQSANSQMRVLCSNNTPYKVDLTYGQYISGSSNIDGYTIYYSGYGNDSMKNFSIKDESSNHIGRLLCGYNHLTGKVYFDNITVANLYGDTNVKVWLNDTKNICVSDGKLTDTYPTGWVGDYNSRNEQPLSIPSSNAFGSMSGAQKGDKLAYKVTLPNDSSKTWTKGLNAYSSNGTGSEQLITVNAQIVPDKSSSTYVAQDVYIDNITAEITY